MDLEVGCGKAGFGLEHTPAAVSVAESAAVACWESWHNWVASGPTSVAAEVLQVDFGRQLQCCAQEIHRTTL